MAAGVAQHDGSSPMERNGRAAPCPTAMPSQAVDLRHMNDYEIIYDYRINLLK